MPLLSPRAVGLVRPQRPLLEMNRGRRCEQGEHDESHHSVPSAAAGPCASLAQRNLPNRSSPLRRSHSARSAYARDQNSRDSPRTEHFMCAAEACFVGAALLAQEPFAFRTVVISGASALRVQTPATALPRSRGHYYSHCPPPPSAGAMPSPLAKAAPRAGAAGSLRRRRARREAQPFVVDGPSRGGPTRWVGYKQHRQEPYRPPYIKWAGPGELVGRGHTSPQFPRHVSLGAASFIGFGN